jgi:hypothetical protein
MNMTRDPHAHTIASAIRRARGDCPPPPDRAIHAEIEAISRRLATIEARVSIITGILAAIAATTGIPALAQALTSIR